MIHINNLIIIIIINFHKNLIINYYKFNFNFLFLIINYHKNFIILSLNLFINHS
jgi:hypothetical protein